MKIITGSLLDQKGILCHQVNLRGIMGAGLALQIRQKWPSAHDDYVRYCREGAKLGDVLFSIVNDDQIVAHCFGQSEISRDHCVTAYEFYPEILKTVEDYSAGSDSPVFIPHGIGCGIASGNWGVMLPLLEKHCASATLVNYEY